MPDIDLLLAGADRLEEPLVARRSRRPVARVLVGTLCTLAIFLGAWQVVAISGWKPDYVLPGPGTVLTRLAGDLVHGDLRAAIATTARRAAIGYLAAFGAGSLLALVAAIVVPLRPTIRAVAGGLQAMPSIAWFPFAVLLFGLNESAIAAVVILGAAPAIVTAVLDGLDLVPRPTRRLIKSLGTTRLQAVRYLELPAVVPGLISGLSLGWAFAWRSLMAGELLLVAGDPSLGVRLQTARELIDAPRLLGTMLVVLALGVIVDRCVFRPLGRLVGRRWGFAP